MLIGVLACFFVMRRIEPVRPSQATIGAMQEETQVTKKKSITTRTTRPDSTVVEVVETDETDTVKRESAQLTPTPAAPVKPKYRLGWLLHIPLSDPLRLEKKNYSVFAGMRLLDTNAHALIGWVPDKKEYSLGLSIDF
jgi:hypothetical protein